MIYTMDNIVELVDGISASELTPNATGLSKVRLWFKKRLLIGVLRNAPRHSKLGMSSYVACLRMLVATGLNHEEKMTLFQLFLVPRMFIHPNRPSNFVVDAIQSSHKSFLKYFILCLDVLDIRSNRELNELFKICFETGKSLWLDNVLKVNLAKEFSKRLNGLVESDLEMFTPEFLKFHLLNLFDRVELTEEEQLVLNRYYVLHNLRHSSDFFINQCTKYLNKKNIKDLLQKFVEGTKFRFSFDDLEDARLHEMLNSEIESNEIDPIQFFNRLLIEKNIVSRHPLLNESRMPIIIALAQAGSVVALESQNEVFPVCYRIVKPALIDIADGADAWPNNLYNIAIQYRYTSKVLKEALVEASAVDDEVAINQLYNLVSLSNMELSQVLFNLRPETLERCIDKVNTVLPIPDLLNPTSIDLIAQSPKHRRSIEKYLSTVLISLIHHGEVAQAQTLINLHKEKFTKEARAEIVQFYSEKDRNFFNSAFDDLSSMAKLGFCLPKEVINKYLFHTEEFESSSVKRTSVGDYLDCFFVFHNNNMDSLTQAEKNYHLKLAVACLKFNLVEILESSGAKWTDKLSMEDFAVHTNGANYLLQSLHKNWFRRTPLEHRIFDKISGHALPFVEHLKRIGRKDALNFMFQMMLFITYAPIHVPILTAIALFKLKTVLTWSKSDLLKSSMFALPFMALGLVSSPLLTAAGFISFGVYLPHYIKNNFYAPLRVLKAELRTKVVAIEVELEQADVEIDPGLDVGSEPILVARGRHGALAVASGQAKIAPEAPVRRPAL